jgi:hypothetical protein
MRVLRILAVVAVITMAVAAVPTLTQAAPLAQNNLIRNPSFEGSYKQFAHFATAQMAPEWLPWWKPQGGGDEPWKNRMPEYKRAWRGDKPEGMRVKSGDTAQQLFTFHGTHDGGVYQRIGGIQPGTRLRFTIWGSAWAGNKDEPDKSEGGGPMHTRIGIDPNGGTDPYSAAIVWSGEGNPLDTWVQFAVEANAARDTVTVFTRTTPEYPSKHNDVYWDDASLIVIAPPAPPTSPPTSTPRPWRPQPTNAPPTATPTPANTPTATPTPTNTPTATPVNTPTPTVTPTPTLTPTPVIVTGSLCVMAYDDRNGSRFRDPGEPLLPYAVFTLSDAYRVVGTYSTNGINEPHCFEELEPGVYFMSEMNPPGYESTTHDSWGISLNDGAIINLEFGDRTEMQPTPTPIPQPSPTPTQVALLSVVGNAMYNYSGIIVLVLAAGVLIAFNTARRQ